MWFHHTLIYGIHTAAVSWGCHCFRKPSCFNTCHTQCAVYVLCTHVYIHIWACAITHAHTLCVCACVHEQSMDHISLKRNKLTCYSCPLCRMGFGWCVPGVISCTGVDQEMETAISCMLILGKRNVMHKYSSLSSSHRCSLCNRWVATSSHSRAQPAGSPSARIPLHPSTTWTFCAKWAQGPMISLPGHWLW